MATKFVDRVKGKCDGDAVVREWSVNVSEYGLVSIGVSVNGRYHELLIFQNGKVSRPRGRREDIGLQLNSLGQLDLED